VSRGLTHLQEAVADGGFAGLLLVSPTNLAYVSGFRANPHERMIALLVPPSGPLRLVCPSLEQESARASLPAGSVLEIWRDEEGPGSALGRALEGIDGTLGVEKRVLSVAFFELAQLVAPANTRFVACDEVLAGLRVRKSESEIATLRQAAAVVDTVVTQLAALALPRMREQELAAECARLLRAEGGEALPFDPLILTGPRSALPHGQPGAAELAEGDLLICDIGVSVDGYFADITRTTVVGGAPDARQQQLFALVHAAQRAGIAAARAGAPCSAVDAAARQVIAAAGYGANFIHRTGHGLGLEVHEPPYLTAENSQRLEPGMVITVEPGIYIEGYGGIRIEDDLVVGLEGAELLTHAPISLVPDRLAPASA
jgi:Xaa-Pro aminopeptidase